MSSHPPTILLPSLPTTLLLGLDTLALTPAKRFTGFTYISSGWHFLYAGSTATLSSRTGYWLYVPTDTQNTSTPEESHLQVFRWDASSETLQQTTDPAELAGWQRRLLASDGDGDQLRKGLLPYRIDPASATPASRPINAGSGRTSHDDDDDASGPASPDQDPEQGAQSSLPSPVDFAELTSHITPALLTRMLGPSSGPDSLPSPSPLSSTQLPTTAAWTISTTSCASEDREEIPGLDSSDRNFGGAASAADARAPEAGEERELRFLGIDLKRTWREGAVGAERTKGARDRSWALEAIVQRASDSLDYNGDREEESESRAVQANGVARAKGKNQRSVGGGEDHPESGVWGRHLLGEMQATFLMVLLLSNWSCLQEWRRVLELALTSREAVGEHPAFFAAFLRALAAQLARCADVEGGLFDVRGEEAGWLKGLLRGFKRGLGDLPTTRKTGTTEEEGNGKGIEAARAEYAKLEAWARREWEWVLDDAFVRRGLVELEDGERVELEVHDADMDAEDETGEYAPVVVEL